MTVSYRALVVDDASDIRLLAELVLSMAGFTVTTASSGKDALCQLAGDDLPDIVVLDVQMPEVDGWETLGRVRGDPRTADLPVVLPHRERAARGHAQGVVAGVRRVPRQAVRIGLLVDELQCVLRRDCVEREALRRVRTAELARAVR